MNLFYNHANCELFINDSDGRLLNFWFVFMDNYVEGDSEGKLIWGTKVTQQDGADFKGVKLFKPMEQLDKSVIENAIKLVEKIPDLPIDRKYVIGGTLKGTLKKVVS